MGNVIFSVELHDFDNQIILILLYLLIVMSNHQITKVILYLVTRSSWKIAFLLGSIQANCDNNLSLGKHEQACLVSFVSIKVYYIFLIFEINVKIKKFKCTV